MWRTEIFHPVRRIKRLPRKAPHLPDELLAVNVYTLLICLQRGRGERLREDLPAGIVLLFLPHGV